MHDDNILWINPLTLEVIHVPQGRIDGVCALWPSDDAPNDDKWGDQASLLAAAINDESFGVQINRNHSRSRPISGADPE
jgi:hypothetical protein